MSLAGTDTAKADPLIASSAEAYDRLMHKYLAGADPIEVATGCRELRKALMARYVN